MTIEGIKLEIQAPLHPQTPVLLPTVVTTWDLSEAVEAQVWVCKFAHIHIYISQITAGDTALNLDIVDNNY